MSQSHDKKPKRWAKPVLIGCLLVPLLICAGGGFFLLNQINGHASKLPKELARLKAMGVPTEAAEMAPNPKIPDAENAATLYGSICYQIEAITADKSQEELVKLLDQFGGPKHQPADLSKVLAALQEKQPIFSDADKLLSKPRLYVDRDYTQGFKLLFPEFASMRHLAKWQCSRAQAQWMSGNRDAALKSLEGAFQISGHLAQEPFLIGHLVSIAAHTIAHQTLTKLMAEVRNDPAMLKRMEAIVAKNRALPDMRLAFGGEVVMGRYGIQNLRRATDLVDLEREEGGRGGSGLVDNILGNAGIRTMYEAKWCGEWANCFEKFPKDKEDWGGMHAVLVEVDRKMDNDKSLENILNRIMFPVMVQAHDSVGKTLAEHRMELVSLRLLQMKKAGLPADLKAFGKTAIDPFSGRAFGYERKGTGFRLWSIGPDLKDNAGALPAKGQSLRDGGDILMSFN